MLTPPNAATAQGTKTLCVMLKHMRIITMKIRTILLISFLTTLLYVGCQSTKSVSTIISDKYDSPTNQTTFEKFPLGSVKIPGKWTKTSYNEVSRQHFFKNVDSVFVAIAINLNTHYPFFVKGMTDSASVIAFYEWDSKFLADQIKGTRTILKYDSINQSIIWHLTDKKEIDSYYLYGCDKGKIFGLFISTNKWNEAEKTNLLETIYKNRIAGN
jgi:hypothetical protein